MNLRSLLSNPGTKALALVIAMIYWILISAPRREKLLDRPYDVPLAFVGVPRDLIITSQLPDSVSVRLRGRLTQLRSLTSQNLQATVDLSNITTGGDVNVPILPQSINVPPDVDVVAINPPKLTIHLEPRRQKTVPIREFLVGQLPAGYSLGQVAVTPPNAIISGPESLVNNIGEVATERVILSGRTQDFDRTVGLVSDNPLVVISEPQAARVSVPVIPPPAPPPEPAPEEAKDQARR